MEVVTSNVTTHVTTFGYQNDKKAIYVNEPGLYDVLLGSQRWVASGSPDVRPTPKRATQSRGGGSPDDPPPRGLPLARHAVQGGQPRGAHCARNLLSQFCRAALQEDWLRDCCWQKVEGRGSGLQALSTGQKPISRSNL